MDDYISVNRMLWDELAVIHAKSAYYDVDGFKKGKSTLCPIVLAGLGQIDGKSLLHLQCHFGLDTLSLARLGASVTGVDFSGEAIKHAKSISDDVGIPARFLLSDVYDLPNILKEDFDIVFASHGVLVWLPDLVRWTAVAAHFLKPSGTFFLVDMHPLVPTLDWRSSKELHIGTSYFHSTQPTEVHLRGSYADRTAKISYPAYKWRHSLGDVVNALISSGLEIEYLREHPETNWDALPFLERGTDGLYRFPADYSSIPLTFSISAKKM